MAKWLAPSHTSSQGMWNLNPVKVLESVSGTPHYPPFHHRISSNFKIVEALSIDYLKKCY
jgi:hypothetical protein